MKNHTKIAVLLLTLCSYAVYSQQAVVSAGGNATGGLGNVSYTVGQITYTTNSNTNFSVAQGVQQPFEISVLSVEEPIQVGIELKAYPNPTADDLILDIATLDTDGVQYSLLDTNGKVLSEAVITHQQTTIHFAGLPGSTYFVRVTAHGKNIKTFKIIKK